MKISSILPVLEKIAPLRLQEEYDNAGLITGNTQMECTGILLSIDATEEVIAEAIEKKCNLIIAHHPIVFKGLKKINGNNYVERAIIKAIKNDIAIYACHTNLDNVIEGVNGKIADKLGLMNRQILYPKQQLLRKLNVYVPDNAVDVVESALFAAGAGHVGNYSQCSFVSDGIGSFLPEENANPITGIKGQRNFAKEKKVEVIFPSWLQRSVVEAMKNNHPYEEVAYEITHLSNEHQNIGSGIIGVLPESIHERDFLKKLAEIFNIQIIKHTNLLGKKVSKVALCGGAGSFLIEAAKAQKADFYISADIKYHEFFDADNQLVLADIGHFESEQFTIELFDEVLRQNFPNFAILKTRVNTNPIQYFRF